MFGMDVLDQSHGLTYVHPWFDLYPCWNRSMGSTQASRPSQALSTSSPSMSPKRATCQTLATAMKRDVAVQHCRRRLLKGGEPHETRLASLFEGPRKDEAVVSWVEKSMFDRFGFGVAVLGLTLTNKFGAEWFGGF